MAKSLSKTGITTGNTVKAFHVTQSIDAFSGTDAYDIVLSGSLEVTGSIKALGIIEASQRVTTPAIRSATGGILITPADDDITLTANVTASGNISASGIITATSFVGNMDGGTF